MYTSEAQDTEKQNKQKISFHMNCLVMPQVTKIQSFTS